MFLKTPGPVSILLSTTSDSKTTSVVICCVPRGLGVFLIFYNKFKIKKIFIYEKIITVLIGYLLFPLIISLPYYLSIELLQSL